MSTTKTGGSTGGPKKPSARNTASKAPPRAGGAGKGTGSGAAGTAAGLPPRRRLSSSLMAGAVVGLVVLIVLVLVLVKVTSGSSPSTTTSVSKSTTTTAGPSSVSPTTQTSLLPGETVAPASLISQVTSVPESVAKAVGAPSSLTAPSVLTGQTPFTLNGKPGVFFLTGEYCPYCAAERWPVLIAFSKFGTFSGVKEARSSAFDVDPSTATFSFYQASYTSSLIGFRPMEVESNVTSASDNPQLLQKPTEEENALWDAYSGELGVGQGFPFLDIDNKVFVVTPGYNPDILAGLDQAQIAAKLTNPNDPVTQGIVGTANDLTAAICSVTGQQPASVCTAAGTTAADKALKLG